MKSISYVTALIEVFGDHKSTKKFVEEYLPLSPIPVNTFETNAYRYLILSITGKEEGTGGWKKPEFEAEKLFGVLSWSKTEAGAEYYVSKHNEPSRLVLLEGKIIAFDLSDYCKRLIKFYEENEPLNMKDYESRILHSHLPILLDQLQKYSKEEELISLEVLSYSIIKDYQKSRGI